MEETDEQKILRLYAQGKWQEIIDNFDKNKYLPWVWPDRKSLEFIGNSVASQKLKSVISVGCGSGLLEWLLASATGMEVKGVEIDGSWWKSRYSPGTFIPMTLVDDCKRGDFGIETANSALLFCYFNNLEAFLHYMDNFAGGCFIAAPSVVNTLIRRKGSTPKNVKPARSPKGSTRRLFPVIGPGPGRGTHTVPEPFCLPGDLSDRWKLFDHHEIRSSRDFIAVYVRK